MSSAKGVSAASPEYRNLTSSRDELVAGVGGQFAALQGQYAPLELHALASIDDSNLDVIVAQRGSAHVNNDNQNNDSKKARKGIQHFSEDSQLDEVTELWLANKDDYLQYWMSYRGSTAGNDSHR